MDQAIHRGREPQDSIFGGRKRNRVGSVMMEDELQLYRIHFSCVHTGRYIASTKRRIKWEFGYVGGDGELHDDQEVELVWSVKSGKVRLHWNKEDISHVFVGKNRPQRNPQGTLTLRWKSDAGLNLAVLANVHATQGTRQYDLIINGNSIFSRPSRADMEASLRDEQASMKPTTMERDADKDIPLSAPSTPPAPPSFSMASGDSEDAGGPNGELHAHHRLAAAGFACQFAMEDELRSDLYSSTLDILRDEVAAAVPETEEMLSRAIIAAFSEDHDSDTSYSHSHESSASEQSERVFNLDPEEVEADLLGEAFEWFRWSGKFVPRADLHDRKQEFMQKHVESIVSHVRHERLSPHGASQIVSRVATMMGFDVSKEPSRDTVVVVGLGNDATTQDVLDVMHSYGDIAYAAISRSHDGFAVCRFQSEPAANRACSAASKNEVTVAGVPVDVHELLSIPADDSSSGLDFLEIRDTMPDPADSLENEKATGSAASDYDVYTRHFIDPSDDAIEATYLDRSTSVRLSDLPSSYNIMGFDSSYSSNIAARRPYKHSNSGIVRSFNLDMDEFDGSGSLVAKEVLE